MFKKVISLQEKEKVMSSRDIEKKYADEGWDIIHTYFGHDDKFATLAYDKKNVIISDFYKCLALADTNNGYRFVQEIQKKGIDSWFHANALNEYKETYIAYLKKVPDTYDACSKAAGKLHVLYTLLERTIPEFNLFPKNNKAINSLAEIYIQFHQMSPRRNWYRFYDKQEGMNSHNFEDAMNMLRGLINDMKKFYDADDLKYLYKPADVTKNPYLMYLEIQSI